MERQTARICIAKMSPSVMASSPPPRKRRTLGSQVSQEKEPDPKRSKLTGQEVHGKAKIVQKPQPELLAEYDRHGVPSNCQTRLNILMSQWGNARWKQILGLWTFL